MIRVNAKMVHCRACNTVNKGKQFCDDNCKRRYYGSLTLQPLRKPLVNFIKNELDKPINNELIKKIEVVDSIPYKLKNEWLSLLEHLNKVLLKDEIRRICLGIKVGENILKILKPSLNGSRI